MPAIVIMVFLLCAWTALTYGQTSVFLQRTRMRDAADAAAQAALGSAYERQLPTYLYERRVPVRNEEGEIVGYKWVLKERNYKPLVRVPSSISQEDARHYFERNLQANGIAHYELLDFDANLSLERHFVDVIINRPVRDPSYRKVPTLMPRWARVRVVAKLRVPAPWGNILGVTTMDTAVSGAAQVTIRGVKIDPDTGQVRLPGEGGWN